MEFTCPTCKSELILRQINFNAAVYLCKNKKCTYPEGGEWIFVKRELDEINKQPQNPQSTTTSLDTNSSEWLDKIFNEDANSYPTNQEEWSNELSAIYDEILNELDTNKKTTTEFSINDSSQISNNSNLTDSMPLLDFFN